MRVGGVICSMRTPNPIAIAACSISSRPIETISPARGLSRIGLEQRPLHQDPEQADEDQSQHHREEERIVALGVDEHDAVGAEHEELAVGEVDHPHHAEDQHQPDRDQRHEGGGVDGVDAGL